MGRSTWEQVFRLCLAESANSTMISASGRQESKAFAAAGSKASRSRAQGFGAWPQPSHPSAGKSCLRKPRGALCWHHKTALPKQGCWVGAMTCCKGKGDSEPRQDIAVPGAVPAWASWTSIRTPQLSPSFPTSHGNHSSSRAVKQLAFLFIYLCTITYQFMMQREAGNKNYSRNS